MAPQLEELGNLKSPKVSAVLNATSINGRDGKVLDKLEESLPARVGLSNDFRLAFTLDPSNGRWVTATNGEVGDFVAGYVKNRNSKSGSGPRFSKFVIPLSKVDANGTIHEISLDGMKVTDPAKNSTLVNSLITMSEHRITPSFYTERGVQKAINYVGALKDGGVIVLNEAETAHYGRESETRKVQVYYVKGKEFGQYTAEIKNFPATDKENQSEKRTFKVFDGHGKQVGDLTINIALVPLVRDENIVQAVIASKEGRGKEVDRDLNRRASDGKIVAVSFTENGASSPIKDLAK